MTHLFLVRSPLPARVTTVPQIWRRHVPPKRAPVIHHYDPPPVPNTLPPVARVTQVRRRQIQRM